MISLDMPTVVVVVVVVVGVDVDVDVVEILATGRLQLLSTFSGKSQ